MSASRRSRNPQPPAPQNRDGQITQSVEVHQSWQGPLPDPHSLEAFRQIVPDAPERIIRQWELEAGHRREYEMTGLKGAIERDRVGQGAAIVFALAALAVGVVALFLGYPAVASLVVGTTVVSVVGAFLYQRKK